MTLYASCGYFYRTTLLQTRAQAEFELCGARGIELVQSGRATWGMLNFKKAPGQQWAGRRKSREETATGKVRLNRGKGRGEERGDGGVSHLQMSSPDTRDHSGDLTNKRTKQRRKRRRSVRDKFSLRCGKKTEQIFWYFVVLGISSLNQKIHSPMVLTVSWNTLISLGCLHPG